MTNTLPDIEPCPPNTSRTPFCLDAAKDAWNHANAQEDFWFDGQLVEAQSERDARQARFDELTQPANLTPAQWALMQARMQSSIAGLYNSAVASATATRDTMYADANADYVKAAEECPCMGNA